MRTDSTNPVKILQGLSKEYVLFFVHVQVKNSHVQVLTEVGG